MDIRYDHSLHSVVIDDQRSVTWYSQTPREIARAIWPFLADPDYRGSTCLPAAVVLLDPADPALPPPISAQARAERDGFRAAALAGLERTIGLWRRCGLPERVARFEAYALRFDLVPVASPMAPARARRLRL